VWSGAPPAAWTAASAHSWLGASALPLATAQSAASSAAHQSALQAEYLRVLATQWPYASSYVSAAALSAALAAQRDVWGTSLGARPDAALQMQLAVLTRPELFGLAAQPSHLQPQQIQPQTAVAASLPLGALAPSPLPPQPPANAPPAPPAQLDRLLNSRRVFQCPVCSKRLCRKTALQVHMRIHTGERPFFCKLCPRRYVSRQALKYHEDAHKRMDRQTKPEAAGAVAVVGAPANKTSDDAALTHGTKAGAKEEEEDEEDEEDEDEDEDEDEEDDEEEEDDGADEAGQEADQVGKTAPAADNAVARAKRASGSVGDAPAATEGEKQGDAVGAAEDWSSEEGEEVEQGDESKDKRKDGSS
jgi:hypothetical protein